MKQRNIEGEYEPNDIVLIKSLDSLKKKLEIIRSDGPSKLSIIADYDDTLIKSSHKKHTFNSFQTLETPSILGPDFYERLLKARHTYRPLESNPKLSPEEKIKYMLEWRKLTLNTFVDRKLTREQIKQATVNGKLCFRFGTAELLKTIIDAKLKLHIVSGGMKCVVRESLVLLEEQNNLKLEDTVTYIMTSDIYDEKGVLIEFGEPVILTGNKQDFITHELCPLIHKENNMIIMGDLIEDSLVANNLNLKSVINIGFISEIEDYEEEQVKSITDVYDIVIANNGNMVHVNELLRYMLGKGVSSEYSKYARDSILKLLN